MLKNSRKQDNFTANIAVQPVPVNLVLELEKCFTAFTGSGDTTERTPLVIKKKKRWLQN